jgi:hypothetical protein
VNDLVVGGRMFVQTNTIVVTNTTTSSALLSGIGTTNIAANLLLPGSVIKTKFWGIYFTSNGTATLPMMKLLYNGAVAAQSLTSVSAWPAGSDGGGEWVVNCESVVRVIGASGKFMTGGTLTLGRAPGTTSDIQSMSNLTTATVDTTAAISVSLEAVLSNLTDRVGIHCQGGTIEISR